MNIESMHEQFLNDQEYRLAYAEEDLIHRVAERVLRLRQHRDMTQTDLAEEIGTKQPDIASIEAGFTNLTLRRVARLACALDCRPEDFITREAPEIMRWKRRADEAEGETICRQEVWSQPNGEYETITSDLDFLAGAA